MWRKNLSGAVIVTFIHSGAEWTHGGRRVSHSNKLASPTDKSAQSAATPWPRLRTAIVAFPLHRSPIGGLHGRSGVRAYPALPLSKETMICFSTSAFKLLSGRLPAGTAKFEFQRAATAPHAALATFVTGPFVLRRLYHDSEGNYSGRREIIFCSPLRVTIRGGGSYIVPLSHIFRGR